MLGVPSERRTARDVPRILEGRTIGMDLDRSRIKGHGKSTLCDLTPSGAVLAPLLLFQIVVDQQERNWCQANPFAPIQRKRIPTTTFIFFFPRTDQRFAIRRQDDLTVSGVSYYRFLPF
jgi:hypothetical protein